MVINKFKKKVIIISTGLIILGLSISLVGFKMANFDLTMFNSNGSTKWYRTIQIDNSSFSLGIDF